MVHEDTFLVSERTPPARERRVAAAVGATLLIAFLGILPFKNLELPVSKAFIPIIDSTLFLTDLITAALFYAQYVVGRRPGLLVLAMGYLFTALIVIPHLLMFPGAFSATGLLGANLQSSAWLYCFRYLGFPVAVIAYTLQPDARAAAGRVSDPGATLGPSIVVVVALVCALTWIAADNRILPPLMLNATRGGPFWRLILAPALLVVHLTAIAVLWRRRSSVLDLWLLLALWAWFIEILLLSLASTRFSAYWYASVFGVVASWLVLIVLLYESTVLYARFALVAAERERERDRQRLTLQVVAGSIAHELQQPLTAIAANSEAGALLLGQTPPDLHEVRAALQEIASDSARASEIINSIRATLTGAAQPTTAVDLNHLVQETLAFLRIELHSKNVSAQLDALPDLPAIKGNKAQLQEVLVNLITNAVDAMSDVTDRPRVLRIRTSRSDPSGVSVRVEDTGPGVSADQAARIFDPFFTTKTGGTGLGLAICRSIVEAHGGLISTARGKEHGSIFQIHLPT